MRRIGLYCLISSEAVESILAFHPSNVCMQKPCMHMGYLRSQQETHESNIRSTFAKIVEARCCVRGKLNVVTLSNLQLTDSVTILVLYLLDHRKNWNQLNYIDIGIQRDAKGIDRSDVSLFEKMKEAKLFLQNTEPDQRILINRVSKNLEPNSNKQTQKSCPFHPKDQILILSCKKKKAR